MQSFTQYVTYVTQLRCCSQSFFFKWLNFRGNIIPRNRHMRILLLVGFKIWTTKLIFCLFRLSFTRQRRLLFQSNTPLEFWTTLFHHPVIISATFLLRRSHTCVRLCGWITDVCGMIKVVSIPIVMIKDFHCTSFKKIMFWCNGKVIAQDYFYTASKLATSHYRPDSVLPSKNWNFPSFFLFFICISLTIVVTYIFSYLYYYYLKYKYFQGSIGWITRATLVQVNLYRLLLPLFMANLCNYEIVFTNSILPHY